MGVLSEMADGIKSMSTEGKVLLLGAVVAVGAMGYLLWRKSSASSSNAATASPDSTSATNQTPDQTFIIESNPAPQPIGSIPVARGQPIKASPPKGTPVQGVPIKGRAPAPPKPPVAQPGPVRPPTTLPPVEVGGTDAKPGTGGGNKYVIHRVRAMHPLHSATMQSRRPYAA